MQLREIVDSLTEGSLLENHTCERTFNCTSCKDYFCNVCDNNPRNTGLCRECQVSSLNDEQLVLAFDDFVVKRYGKNCKSIDSNGFPFAEFEFEIKNYTGDLRLRSDGQLDVNVVNMQSEESCTLYKILLSREEIAAYLHSFFLAINKLDP